MKKALFVLFVGLGLSAFAQKKSEQALFFNQFIKSGTDVTVYTESVGDYYLKDLKKTLQKHKTMIRPDYGEWRNLKSSVPKSITLSKSEIDYVMAQLEKANKNPGWSKGSIENSRLVTSAEIDSVFRDQSKSWPYFKKHYGKSLSTFSKPVFLRDNTFCIFYKAGSGGDLSGGGGFSLYAKDRGVWRLYGILTMWIS